MACAAAALAASLACVAGGEEPAPPVADQVPAGDTVVTETDAEEAADETAVGAGEPVGEPTAEDRVEYTGPEQDQVFFQAYWDEGVKYRLLGSLRIEEGGHLRRPYLTRDPLVTGELGFRLHVDASAYVEADGLRQIGDGIDVRRSFLVARGTVFALVYPIDFNIQMGAITSNFFIDTAYLQLNDLPYIGSIRAGQYTAPMSFDAVYSSRDRGFMENPSPVQAFGPGTLAGINVADSNRSRRTTWALGWFANGQEVEVGDASQSFARFIGRATWVPLVYSQPQPALLHVGIGGSYLFSNENSIRYQSRPESFLAPFVIDTGEIDARNAFVLDTEIAFISGPWSGQFEYLQAFVGGGEAGSVDFPGLYFQVNRLLTGETRPYNYARGVFDQLIPNQPLSWDNGTWGALEWGGRYSYTNLDDGPVRGGKMHMLSLGLNWYWNRYIRWQTNYGVSFIDGGPYDGILNVFQVRFQIEV